MEPMLNVIPSHVYSKAVMPNKSSNICSLLSTLSNNETRARKDISLIASENTLSPLAKLPFLLDLHARYFLDERRRFNKWLFPNGAQLDEIENDLLIPLLSELAGATYVNVRPISGMNCMTIALAALTEPGDMIFAIPIENGGHSSTAAVATKLALQVEYLPFLNAYDIDYEQLEKKLAQLRPKLIYIDQANFLFPIDPQCIRQLIDRVSPETIIHYDSSHTNGLIIGKAMFNPLQCGAHCYGGSTHKTLPGPHKAFLATHDASLAAKIDSQARHFVSQHHPSSMVSLLITLMEMKECQGEDYAKQVLTNTQVFAQALANNGFHVAAQSRGYTECHQLWTYPAGDNASFFNSLTKLGIMTNRFDNLPGINQPAFRLSFAEATRLGATATDAKTLASIMAYIVRFPKHYLDMQEQVALLSQKLAKPNYCYQLEDFEDSVISREMKVMCEALYT